MIIVTGDLHGDWGRLNALIASKRPEIILQCGDFGWWPQLEVKKPIPYGLQKKWTHKGLKTGSSSVYFCDGNHEQHPVLVQDGMIHEMYDNVFHASRGSVLTLPDGRNVLFFGGAASVDKDMRTAGYDWFPEESISEVEFERCFDLDCKIDIVITVTCGHIDYKGVWVMRCNVLNINTEPLGAHCKTASQAKQEAISIVRRKIESLSESVKKIELATD